MLVMRNKKKTYPLLLLLIILAMLFVQPASEAIATRTTPGFAIGSIPFHFLGGFLPGWHWGLEYWREEADHDLITSARESGMTVMHIMLPLFEGPLGDYDETKLRKLDHFLDSAYNSNMYVMPSFIQAYSETLVPGNTEYPYYHPRSIEGIIKDPTLRQAFRNRIAALVNRQNTYNGRYYKDDPTIMAWIVCDEPISGPFNYPNGLPQITLAELTDWFQETASYIKSIDSSHLVTVWAQPAIQEFFGWTLDYLQALGIPEFDFMYTEDADLTIVPGLPLGYNCSDQTPQYMLDQFLPGKPVVFHPAFTSGCWDTNIICDSDFTVQSTHLNLAIPEYFAVGGNAVLIQNWGTDLYSSVPGWAQCRTYTDSYPKIVAVAHTHSALVNPDGHPVAPLGFVRVIYGLNTAKYGSGSGTITSNPTGISCGSDCSEAFSQGNLITLTAHPDPDSIFAGWSGGDCSGTGTCSVTMDAEIAVTATFSLISSMYELNVVRSGSGSGTITSNPTGISCGSDCTESYSEGQSVTLNAAASPGSVFAGWSGGECSGTGMCVISITTDVTVTAMFNIVNVPPELSTDRGTIGTQLTITGSDFGVKTGKILIGGVATKIAKDGWKPDSISCNVTKVPLPADTAYDVKIISKEIDTKTLSKAFTVKLPEIDSLDFYHGVADDPITITGNFFSTKKGKVYLEVPGGKPKSCKVTSWGMDSITFAVPKTSKSFPVGTYPLKVTNKVGTTYASPNFTVN